MSTWARWKFQHSWHTVYSSIQHIPLACFAIFDWNLQRLISFLFFFYFLQVFRSFFCFSPKSRCIIKYTERAMKNEKNKPWINGTIESREFNVECCWCFVFMLVSSSLIFWCVNILTGVCSCMCCVLKRACCSAGCCCTHSRISYIRLLHVWIWIYTFIFVVVVVVLSLKARWKPT